MIADLPASKFFTKDTTAVNTEIEEATPAIKKRIKIPTNAPVPVASVRNERGIKEIKASTAATMNEIVFGIVTGKQIGRAHV